MVAVKGNKVMWVQTKTNCLPPPAYRQLLSEFPGGPNKFLHVWYDNVKEPRIIKM